MKNKGYFYSVAIAVLLPGLSMAETLHDVATEVLNSHPDIRREQANVSSVEQAKQGAIGDYLPTLDLTGAIGHETSYEKNLNGSDVNLTRSELSLVFNQNLFKGFGSDAEYDRQAARHKAAAFSLNGTAQNILLRMTAVYLDVLRYQKILELSEEFVAAHKKIFTQVQARFNSGVGSDADNEQVRVRLTNAQSNEIAANNNYQDALSRYKAVVGVMPNHLLLPSQVEGLPDTLIEAIDRGFENHPVLKSANADIEEGQAQYEAAKAPYYPQLDFEVAGSWDENQAGFDGKDHDVTMLLKLKYNLFNGTKDLYKKEETAQLVNVAKKIRDQTKREVEEGLRLAWRAYEALDRQIPYLTERFIASQATYDGYAEQFKIGRRTLLDMLDTKSEVYQAEVDKVNAEYDYHYAQYRILNAIGSLDTYIKKLAERSKVTADHQVVAKES